MDAQELKNAIDTIRRADLTPQSGLGEDLFLMVSGLVPLPNIDLLVQNDAGQILLTRRNDRWFQNSWHIPGGCMRYGETFEECIRATSLRELGIEVYADEQPLTVQNVISGPHPDKPYPRERGHNVAILFGCAVPAGWNPDNGNKKETDNGYMKWFSRLPDDFMDIQHVYDKFLKAWQ